MTQNRGGIIEAFRRLVSRGRRQEGETGRRFDKVARAQAMYDLRQIEKARATLTPSQARHLAIARRLLTKRAATDGDVADALYELRYASAGLPIKLLIVRRRLES